ncbi:MAG: thiamine phosphate synthase [Muribaculaceae bacterium]
MLQFITNSPTKQGVIDQVNNVLAGGCKWIQLRMKDAPRELIAETATAIKPLCEQAQAILVIDDHVDLAKELALDGVHLGKTDMDVKQAREMLGEEFIIGATANTLNDVLEHSPVYVDYIGVGPYRFTTTKKNLSPVVGLQGYANIVTVEKSTNKEIPLVAIGGIEYDDIEPIMATGIDGIAVSGAITRAANPTSATKDFVDLLNNILEKRLKQRGLL